MKKRQKDEMASGGNRKSLRENLAALASSQAYWKAEMPLHVQDG